MPRRAIDNQTSFLPIEDGGDTHVLIPKDNAQALDELGAQGMRFQLVYMDPPYNTGRLRGARKEFRDSINSQWRGAIQSVVRQTHALLLPSGFLAVSINQMELFNLKPLLDETFGAECFIGLFPVKIRHRDRQLMINATFHDLFEYLLIYRKNAKSRFVTTHKSARTDKFNYLVRAQGAPTQVLEIKEKRVEVYSPNRYEIATSAYTPETLRRYVIAGKLATANWSGEWYESNLRQLGDDLLIRVWGLEKEGLGYRWFQTGNSRRSSGVYFQSQLNAGRPVLPCNDLDYTEVVPTTYKEGGPGCDFKDSKKPEALLSFLLGICTQKGDMVLDPYGGSGTTLAVAAKMGRSAVLIENNAAALAIIRNRVRNLGAGRDVDGVRYGLKVAEWGTKSANGVMRQDDAPSENSMVESE